MPELSRKTLSFEVKSLGDNGEFSLYAAVFGNVDRQGDVIAPGAFRNTAEFVRDGWGAVNHQNWGGDLGVAMIDNATQDAKGLLVSGVFHSTDDAQRIRTKIKERMARGKTVSCSIGYEVTDSAVEMRDGKPINLLKALNVYEFSFVNMPANPEASVMSAKSLETKDSADVKLNSAAVTHARGLIKAGKTDDGAWSFSGVDGDKLLGDPPDWAEYGKWFLGIDQDIPEETKGRYKYPVGKGGKVYLAALRAVASRASGQGLDSVSEAASKLLESANDGGKEFANIRAKGANPPRCGDHVMIHKDMGGGCGTVKSIHSEGMVPHVFGESLEGTREYPAARMDMHDHDHKSTGLHKAVALHHLTRIDQPADAYGMADSDDGKSFGDADAAPSLDAFSRKLVADLGSFTGLLRKCHGLRTKAGRTLSEANRRRIKAAVEAAQPMIAAMKDLESLHRETDPDAGNEPDSGDPDAAEEAAEGEKAARLVQIQRLQLEAAALDL